MPSFRNEKFYQVLLGALKESINSTDTINVSFSDEAQKLWEKFYKIRTEQGREYDNDVLSALSARELSMTNKIACISALLSSKRRIEIADLFYSNHFVIQSVLNSLNLMYGKKFNQNLSKDEQRLYALLEQTSPRSKTEIANTIGGKQDKINIALKTLVAKQLVEESNSEYSLSCATPNCQEELTKKYLLNSNIYELFQKLELGKKSQINSPNFIAVPSHIGEEDLRCK